jgi:hypothetical protein
MSHINNSKASKPQHILTIHITHLVYCLWFFYVIEFVLSKKINGIDNVIIKALMYFLKKLI